MARGSKILGHPMHSALVHVPVTLLPLAFVCDAVAVLASGGFWPLAATWCLRVGVLFAVAAAGTGLMDFLTIPRDSDARATATAHLALNLAAIVLFLAAVLLRDPVTGTEPSSSAGLLLVEGAGTLVLAVSGTLGSKLTYKLGVGQLRDEDQPLVVRTVTTVGPRTVKG